MPNERYNEETFRRARDELIAVIQEELADLAEEQEPLALDSPTHQRH